MRGGSTKGRRRSIGVTTKIFWAVLVVFWAVPVFAGGWFVGSYGGSMSGDDLISVITLDAEYESDYFWSFFVGKEVWRYKALSLEGEGQIVPHWGNGDYLEFAGLIVLRWDLFPWNHVVKTSVAVGEGLSYTTKISPVEEKHHDETSKWLDYMTYEISLGLPQWPHWELIGRIHHRSGVYGLFQGVHGASNGVGIGVRYRF